MVNGLSKALEGAGLRVLKRLVTNKNRESNRASKVIFSVRKNRTTNLVLDGASKHATKVSTSYVRKDLGGSQGPSVQINFDRDFGR